MLEGSDIANQKWRSNTTALNVERGRERYQIEFPSFSKGNVILIVAVVGARESWIKWIFAFLDDHYIIFQRQKNPERYNNMLYIFGL